MNKGKTSMNFRFGRIFCSKVFVKFIELIDLARVILLKILGLSKKILLDGN